MPVPFITDIQEVVAAGNDYEVTSTLTQDDAVWDLSAGGNATVTCSIYDERDMATALISGVSVALVTANLGIVRLTLTDVQTDALHAPLNFKETFPHIADFKVVESDGNVTNGDPWRLFIRRAVTA